MIHPNPPRRRSCSQRHANLALPTPDSAERALRALVQSCTRAKAVASPIGLFNCTKAHHGAFTVVVGLAQWRQFSTANWCRSRRAQRDRIARLPEGAGLGSDTRPAGPVEHSAPKTGRGPTTVQRTPRRVPG